jgi:serine/threonine protein kinase
LGLDYLHDQLIAHRDIQPANVCVALDYDLSALSENEIQKAVWPVEAGEEPEKEFNEETEANRSDKILDPIPDDDTSSDSDSDSDDSAQDEWQRKFEETKRLAEEQWAAFEAGDKLAEPLSDAWNKANFINSRDDIELLQRVDGKPLSPDEIHYTVTPTPLDSSARLNESTRLVLVDLGFACSFDECEKLPLRNLSDFRPPELLLNVPTTHKADIFSLGLLFWEIVMLRLLVETRYSSNGPERICSNNRLLRDQAQRLGLIPATIRVQWRDADKFLDSDGNALDIQKHDGEEYGPDEYDYGDIWHHARRRTPLDMSHHEMDVFVNAAMGSQGTAINE